MNRIRSQSKSRKGVALITAMMVMSLATITAVSMTANQQIYFHRTQNILLHEQAYIYHLSAEDMAKVALSQDANNNQTDSYSSDEAWYTDEPQQFPIEGGGLSGLIRDLQGKININNFAKDPIDQWDRDRLATALSNHNLSSDLADVIIDWIDANTSPLPNGAESVDYLNNEIPYRAADGMMGSISELKLLRGMDDDTYKLLQEIFVALPATNIAININTAPPAVLRVIVPGLSESEAEDLAKDLQENPLNSPDDLLGHSLVKGAAVDTHGLSVETDYFLLESMVVVDRAVSKMKSVIYRQDGDNIHVVQRSQGEL